MDHHPETQTVSLQTLESEHRKLAAFFEEFSAVIQQSGSGDRAQIIVRDALQLANEHFEHEEALMQQVGYPGIEDEQRNHRNLRLQLTALVGDTLAMPGNNPMTLESLCAMRKLLAEHMTGPDHALSNFMLAKNAPAAAA